MSDTVIFGDFRFDVPSGHTEQEIREALEDQAPSIASAKLVKVANDDGSYTWNFAETAGTKGIRLDW